MINTNILIDVKGKYVTRNGLVVDIQELDEEPDVAITAFKCKGYIFHPRPDKKDKIEWNIWHRSGAFSGFPDPRDIVSKLSSSS